MVEEDNTPLSVMVTPCDAPLEWKLTLQELPEEASGQGSGMFDIRQQQERLMMGYVEISLLCTITWHSDARLGVLAGFN